MRTATLSTFALQPRILSPEDITGSMAALLETYARPTSAGVCVADGFGVRVIVERGALVVADGIGEHRRTRRFDKATHGLSRIIVIASSEGFVTFEALRWCQRLGIAVLALGADGTPSLASAPRTTDDARLRRTQALAPFAPYGLDVAQWLMARKIMGQGKLVLQRFDDSVTAETIGDLALATEGAGTIEELRQLEASAAALYFGAWLGRAECVPTFVTKDRRRIPPHWLRFEGRRSVLASAASNRKAERPVNALLNYLYSLVEAEAILSCQAVGLDPGLGIVHADAKGRQSLALDLMEPVRPEVDAFVLDMVERRTFRRAEFTETSDGHVRLLRAAHSRAGRDDASVGQVARPDRRACRPCLRQGDGRHVLGDHSTHVPPLSRCTGGREGTQGRGVTTFGCRPDSPAPICSAGCSCVVDLSRLRRSCHELSPRPLRGVHRRRPSSGARDQGTAWRRHRRSQAGAGGVGQGQSRGGLRPRAVPAGDPAEARDCAACRDHRGGRLL